MCTTCIYMKRDNFNFKIVNFPHLCSKIPSKPAYGVYISQLVRIGRICSSFVQFKERHYKLTWTRYIHIHIVYIVLRMYCTYKDPPLRTTKMRHCNKQPYLGYLIDRTLSSVPTLFTVCLTVCTVIECLLVSSL